MINEIFGIAAGIIAIAIPTVPCYIAMNRIAKK